MDTQHASDCARHNAPAYESGECDCKALRADKYLARKYEAYIYEQDEPADEVPAEG